MDPTPPPPPTTTAPSPTSDAPPPTSASHPQPPRPTPSQIGRPRPPTSAPPPRTSGLAIGVPARPHTGGGPVPFSSFGPTSSFGGLPHPRGNVDHNSNSASQGKPSLQGIQTIGMVGSLSTASHMRPIAVSGQQLQHRPGQPPLRSITTPTNPSMTNPGLMRGLSQTSQSLQQPWMLAQGKPMHSSALSSATYRPQVRPHVMQNRAQHPQQGLSAQQQLQQKQFQQQKQQQINVPQQQSGNPTQQQLLSKSQQVASQQQIASRAAIQKSSISGVGQPGTTLPGVASPAVNADDIDSGNQILSKRSIHDLVSQVDPSEKLDPEVEDILVEIADDFVESITTVACSFAKHRKSSTLEAKDILLHLERNWNMTLPGFGGDELKGYKKPFTNDIHKERLAVIKKSMTGNTEVGNAKNSTTGQNTTNSKSHVPKAQSVIGSPR